MEILRELQRMGKTIFISSHILSELAELCDSVTIIDGGRVKYSGDVDQLLIRNDRYPTYRLALGGNDAAFTESLRALPGVVAVERIDGRPEYRVSFDGSRTDTNRLLHGILNLGVPLLSFTEERRHLNEAFMDLTAGGLQ
jgi:ABC-2 type transport system ATP-binding protein